MKITAFFGGGSIVYLFFASRNALRFLCTNIAQIGANIPNTFEVKKIDMGSLFKLLITTMLTQQLGLYRFF